MPVLRCTSDLLAGIDNPALGESPPLTAPLGDWYGHLFTVDRRKCLMFMNEPTLFVCPAFDVVKAEYRDISPLFRRVLAWTLRATRFPEGDVAWIIGLHEDLALGRTVNRTTVGCLNNRVAHAKDIFHRHGGIDFWDIADLAVSLNETPMKRIGYSNGLEKMQQLVDKCLNRTVREKIRPPPPPPLPPCPQCGKPLLNYGAQQCFKCGADWHGKTPEG